MFIAFSVKKVIKDQKKKKKHNSTCKKQAAYLKGPILQVPDCCGATSCD